MQFVRYCLGLIFWGFSSSLYGHGLIQDPPSRSWLCGAETTPDEIDNGLAENPWCEAAFEVDPLAAYNYMAVLTHSWGRAQVTPLPQNVCSFDSESWDGAVTPWDVPLDWPATPMNPGKQTFIWNLQWGPHFDDTYDFSYWITKPDFAFSSTRPLTWDDFEAEPFCVVLYDDSDPTGNPDARPNKANSLFETDCEMPPRAGHHVIYGEWGRTEPTIERFHGCVDAAFGGTVNLQNLRAPKAYPQRPHLGEGQGLDALGRNRLNQAPTILVPNP